jgi:hypothetical protein
MAAINIDQLALKLSGVSERDGQRLAQQIADGLAHASISAESSQQLDALRVNVTARPGDSMDWLSKQIIADILRQLNRTLT